jgi:phosphoribosyl-ATP pyrophosphohydrolase
MLGEERVDDALAVRTEDQSYDDVIYELKQQLYYVLLLLPF